MKKTTLIVCVFSLLCLIQCGPSSDEIEIIYEDGVEVVLNHMDPYKIKGQPYTFILEEELLLIDREIRFKWPENPLRWKLPHQVGSWPKYCSIVR